MNAAALNTIALQKQSPDSTFTKRGAPTMLAMLGLSIIVFVVLPAINGTNVIKAWKETHS